MRKNIILMKLITLTSLIMPAITAILSQLTSILKSISAKLLPTAATGKMVSGSRPNLMEIKRVYNFPQIGEKDMYLLHHEELESFGSQYQRHQENLLYDLRPKLPNVPKKFLEKRWHDPLLNLLNLKASK